MKSFIADKNRKLSKLALYHVENLSFSTFQKMLRDKDVKVNGKRVNKDLVLEIGDKVVVKFDHAKNAEIVKVTHIESEKVVYVTKEGNHYHYSNDCSYLIDNRDNMIEILESVAIQFGYADACGICAK